MDWITIPGATIRELSYAWRLDYHKEPRPQRVMMVAGLNDLIRGGDSEKFKEQVLQFEEQVDHQNRYHFTKNEFIVAPLLNPPKLCWFSDNGREPPEYNNRVEEIHNINTWIKEFNSKNNMVGVPNYQS